MNSRHLRHPPPFLAMLGTSARQASFPKQKPPRGWLERIELSSSAPQADVLPLNYSHPSGGLFFNSVYCLLIITALAGSRLPRQWRWPVINYHRILRGPALNYNLIKWRDNKVAGLFTPPAGGLQTVKINFIFFIL